MPTAWAREKINFSRVFAGQPKQIKVNVGTRVLAAAAGAR